MLNKVNSAAEFVQQEHEILDFWDRQGIFAKLVARNEAGEPWSFLDGPITANNPMGVHHAWGRTYKDCFQRFHAMKGHSLRYQNGFDCQGLWVEVEVEKELGFKTKRDIETYGLERFVEKCKERASKYAAIQSKQSIRLGYWMDWDNSYFTMSDENNYTIWTFLKKCHDRGLIYKGADSMPWCPRCGTGISQHEMHEGYKEVADTAVFLRMPLRGRTGEFLLVWTTTPWTLAANVACAVHPELSYVKVRQGDDIYYLAAALIDIMKERGKVEVLAKMTGREMVGWTYDGPFDELPAQSSAKEHHRVVAWDVVSETEGTGIVHIAPGCGKEDFELAGEIDLPVLAPIDESGIYVDEYGWLTGRAASGVGEDVLEDLRKKGVYYKREEYRHNYPHCWRCSTALLFRHVHEWFIDMSWRDEIKSVVKQIRWLPEWGQARELDWLDNMRDWMISKKRYWGLALPIYECDCGWFDVLGSEDELRKRAVAGWEEFEGNSPHRPWIDAVKIRCERCGKVVSRIADVGNPWLDAGIVPYSTVRYNTDREYWSRWVPADLVLECFPGQFRNWFYALLAMSTMMENIPPFKTLFGHGLVRDEHGEEMHKSSGNAIWFDDAAEKMGVDIMRWTFCRQTPESNLNFGYSVAKQIERTVFNTWWNVYAFFCNYARLDGFDPTAEQVPVEQRPDMDRWILSNVNLLVDLADKSLANYEVAALMRGAEEFIERLSNWYVRRNRRRFWRARDDSDADKLAAYQTLYEVLVTLCKTLAPIVPFVTEAMYRNLVCGSDEEAPESVHLCAFPHAEERLIDRDLSHDMDATVDFVSRVLGLRQARQIRVRQPLARVTVTCQLDKIVAALQRFEDQIIEELNVKELAFVEDASALVETLVKPNFRTLGPRFGKDMPKIANAVDEGDARQMAERLNAGLPVSVTVEGSSYDLQAEELVVELRSPDHLEVQKQGDMTVALDTNITPELEAEGLARDVVRHVQILRKELDLEMDDRIRLSYEADDELLGQAMHTWLEHIKAETLARDTATAIDGDPSRTVDICGHNIRLKIEKIA